MHKKPAISSFSGYEEHVFDAAELLLSWYFPSSGVGTYYEY